VQRSKHTVAACAVLIVLLIAGSTVTLMRSAHAQDSVTIDWQPLDEGMQPLEAVCSVLVSSSIAGVLGWVLRFALRRDGIHRLAAANPIYPRKLTS
jgi:hypothetical protein